MPTKQTRTAVTEKELRAAEDRFIGAWGQMGSAWGISRTMAEVHALLYITGEAQCTDDVMERLQISRGNASMSLRALLDWGIVTRTSKRGDRKEYFRAESDVWAMIRAIVRERMKREVEPALASLYEIRDMTSDDAVRARATREGQGGASENAEPARINDFHERMDEMIRFFTTLEGLSQRFVGPTGRGLQVAASLLVRA